VESVVDLLAGQAARKKLGLLCWTDPELPRMIYGDPVRLRQVLLNLIGNAVKFTAGGEIFVKLSVRNEVTGTLLHVDVTDTGIGIPSEMIQHLFNAFTQVDASTTRKFGGTGLGLAISHRLIRKMGGRIWVESREGLGSHFQFEIPLHPAASANGLRRPYAVHDAAFAGKRVLILDRSANSRWILCRHAESFGMVPVAVQEAEEALTLIAGGRQPFDLAVVDQMSGEDSLVSKIRRVPGGNHLPILMLTWLGENHGALNDTGLEATLAKPVKASSLLQAFRTFLTPASALPLSRQAAPVSIPSIKAADSSAFANHPQPLRILVAEDNPVNQKVVSLHLQRLGYQAVLTSNGLEALQAVQSERFDVLLLDVQMPVMDGLEAARQICQSLLPEDRPWMIALTANAFGSDREGCLEAGMNDYLSKPVRADNLQHALRMAYEAKGKGSALMA
jgi:CheY-like chemotaxis protein